MTFACNGINPFHHTGSAIVALACPRAQQCARHAPRWSSDRQHEADFKFLACDVRAGQFHHFTTSRAEATPAQASLFEAA